MENVEYINSFSSPPSMPDGRAGFDPQICQKWNKSVAFQDSVEYENIFRPCRTPSDWTLWRRYERVNEECCGNVINAINTRGKEIRTIGAHFNWIFSKPSIGFWALVYQLERWFFRTPTELANVTLPATRLAKNLPHWFLCKHNNPSSLPNSFQLCWITKWAWQGILVSQRVLCQIYAFCGYGRALYPKFTQNISGPWVLEVQVCLSRIFLGSLSPSGGDSSSR